jgi:hypothetical protein
MKPCYMVSFINVVHVKGSDTSYSKQELAFVSIDTLSSFGTTVFQRDSLGIHRAHLPSSHLAAISLYHCDVAQ